MPGTRFDLTGKPLWSDKKRRENMYVSAYALDAFLSAYALDAF